MTVMIIQVDRRTEGKTDRHDDVNRLSITSVVPMRPKTTVSPT